MRHPRGRRLTEWSLLLVCELAFLYGGTFIPLGPIRALFVLPGLLFVPGFALASLALDRGEPHDLPTLGVFSFTMSLGIIIADALILNAIRIRFSATSLNQSALIAASALIMANMLFGRRVGFGLFENWDRFPSLHPKRTWLRIIAIGASITLAFNVVALASKRIPLPNAPHFLSLSLGVAWAARSSSLRVSTGERVAIPVVVMTRGTTTGSYTLSVSVDGKEQSASTIALTSHVVRHKKLLVIAPRGKGLHRVDISLLGPRAHHRRAQVIVYLNNSGR